MDAFKALGKLRDPNIADRDTDAEPTVKPKLSNLFEPAIQGDENGISVEIKSSGES